MASVKVAVRARPLNQRELDLQSKPIIEMCGNKTSILNVKLPAGLLDLSDIGRERLKEFTFDYSYWSCNPADSHFTTQEQVFHDLGIEVVENAFIGYNACVFAYGQTGSGKTYTMMGAPDSEGLIPRICQDLFARMKVASKSGTTFRTEVSYLEIYNERVKDLLRKNAQHNLKVREHPKLGPYVQDLSHHYVMDYTDVQELMTRGNSHRTTAATAMNDVSSRSHAIFTLTFTQAKFHHDMPSETVSKVNLVDLAGSERADASGATGQRLKEGGHINKSLVTLGSVISALADMSGPGRKSVFIPYRDSVLTWLLKDSLGGNSKTIMIATISPAECNYGESLSTLRYASRAKNIINRPTINEDPNVKLIRDLRDEIANLKSMLEDTMNSSPNVIEKLQFNEARVKVLTEEWTEKWRDIQKILQEQRTLGLRKAGSGVILDSAQPHLIGLDDDVLSTGISLYHLKEGCTTVGTIESENKVDIELTGIGIERDHCLIELKNGISTLIPLGNSPCCVNTLHVDTPTRLSQGCIILLGASNMFRFNDPAEVQRLRKDKGRGSNWSLPRLSLMSRSVSDLAKSLENLTSSPISCFDSSSNEKELLLLEEKKQRIEELETEHRQAEEKRLQEHQKFQEEMEAKRNQLEILRQETLQMQKDAEEAQRKVAEQEKRLSRRSLDVEKQFQQYIQDKQKMEESMHQMQQQHEAEKSLYVVETASPTPKEQQENVLSWLQKKVNRFPGDETKQNGVNRDDSGMQFCRDDVWVKNFLSGLPSLELSQELERRLTARPMSAETLFSICNEIQSNIMAEKQFIIENCDEWEVENQTEEVDTRLEKLAHSRELIRQLIKQKQELKDCVELIDPLTLNQTALEDKSNPVEVNWDSSSGDKEIGGTFKNDCETENRLWNTKSVQDLENLILQSAESSSQPGKSIESRIMELRELESRFREIEEDMEERLMSLEEERGRELDAIELEKFRLEEMQQQKRISALVEWEVRRRLLDERKQIISSKLSVASDDELGSLSPTKWRRFNQSFSKCRDSLDNSEPNLLNSRSLSSLRDGTDLPSSRLSITRSVDADARFGEPTPYRLLIPSYIIRGSGTAAHYEYEVKIWACDDHWTVYRRYKRFRELHHFMRQKFGNKLKLPYFPPKKIFGNRSEKVVQERRKHLELYLQELISALRKVRGNPISTADHTSLYKKDLCELSPFFQKGCFETTRHGTG